MKHVCFVLLACLLCCGCATHNNNILVPDLNKVGRICDSLISSGYHTKAARLYFQTGQDLGSSELYVYAAWQYGEAKMGDSALISINHAIDHGMSNPRVLELYNLTNFKYLPLNKQVQKRLDSITHALSKVANFDVVTEPYYSFWPYFKSALSDTTSAKKHLNRYIRLGSHATKEYFHKRYETVDGMFSQMIQKNPKHYIYTQQFLDEDKISSLKDTIKGIMHRLSKIYPRAVFPKVYLVPGILTGNGTQTEMGLFIAAEMFVKSETMSTTGMTNWELKTIAPSENMKFVTTHELMHFQQAYSDNENGTNLLGKVIIEGVCDFFVELLADDLDPLRRQNIVYLDNSENLKFILSEFKKEMYLKNLSKWMYNGGGIKDRPSDIGYALGYKICKSYYDRSTDKKDAIVQLLTTGNFNEILAGSEFAFLL